MLKKNTSDLQLIEPRFLWARRNLNVSEVWYFRTSNGISPGPHCFPNVSQGEQRFWYETASIPVETTNQSVCKNNLWSSEILILSDHRPVRNFSKSDI